MELPHLGEHCSEKSCNRLDFLPLKCDVCEDIFCAEHVNYVSHDCPRAYEKDVQVPACPLCLAPIPSSKRGDPPDLAVSRHIDNDCQSDIGKSRRKIFINKCSFKGCKIKEIVQVKCDECRDNYCLKHRHPGDHSCVGEREAIRRRLKRLEAVTTAKTKTTKPSSNDDDDDDSSHDYSNIQGPMSEDEALARALQASLQEAPPQQPSLGQASQPLAAASPIRDRCRLS